MTSKLILSVVLLAGTSTAALAISPDSIDTFEVDNEGWRVGGAGTDPTQVADASFDGQPGFLRHESDGGGSNGKWLTWSEQSDWTGDYIEADVSAISLWADGRTGADLPFWLGFDGPGGWFLTPAQTIVTDDDWKRLEFDITESGLKHFAASGETGVYADTLSNVTRFEMFAGPGPVSFASRGDLLRAGNSQNVVWIDNIAAVAAIPEPASLTSLGILLAATLAGYRGRRQGSLYFRIKTF